MRTRDENYRERHDAYIELEDVTIVRATGKAALCRFEDDSIHWIPFSQIHDDCEVYQEGDTGTLIITEWIAKQKGLL